MIEDLPTCDCGAALPPPIDRAHISGDVLICDACGQMWTMLDLGTAFVMVLHAPATDAAPEAAA